MEMQENDHFAVTRLIKCVFDIVVKDVDFISTNAGILKTIDMGLQYATQPFCGQVRPDIKVF